MATQWQLEPRSKIKCKSPWVLCSLCPRSARTSTFRAIPLFHRGRGLCALRSQVQWMPRAQQAPAGGVWACSAYSISLESFSLLILYAHPLQILPKKRRRLARSYFQLCPEAFSTFHLRASVLRREKCAVIRGLNMFSVSLLYIHIHRALRGPRVFEQRNGHSSNTLTPSSRYAVTLGITSTQGLTISAFSRFGAMHLIMRVRFSSLVLVE